MFIFVLFVNLWNQYCNTYCCSVSNCNYMLHFYFYFMNYLLCICGTHFEKLLSPYLSLCLSVYIPSLFLFCLLICETNIVIHIVVVCLNASIYVALLCLLYELFTVQLWNTFLNTVKHIFVECLTTNICSYFVFILCIYIWFVKYIQYNTVVVLSVRPLSLIFHPTFILLSLLFLLHLSYCLLWYSFLKFFIWWLPFLLHENEVTV